MTIATTFAELSAGETYPIALSHLCLVTVTGADAATYLQGQLTCDITQLADGKARLGAYCNQKGRVIASFFLWQQTDGFALIMSEAASTPFIEILAKYAVFSKVTITNNDNVQLSASLHSSDELLGALTVKQEAQAFAITHDADTTTVIINETPRLTLTIAKDSEAKIHDKASSNLWHSLEAATGITLLSDATVERYLPHDLNLPKLGAVSFTKGCYLGQEIVARMEHLGKTKKQLYSCIFRAKTTPRLNQTINVQGAVIGHIILVADLASDEYLILAVIRDDALSKNQKRLVTDEGYEIEIRNPA